MGRECPLARLFAIDQVSRLLGLPMHYRSIALSKEGVFGWRSDFECAVRRGKARWRQALISLGCDEKISAPARPRSPSSKLYLLRAINTDLWRGVSEFFALPHRLARPFSQTRWAKGHTDSISPFRM